MVAPSPYLTTRMTDPQAISRIRLRMLRYFQVLADELHFGRAAARLNISQPPLSMQIKELEEILEVDLFERSSRRVVLTHAGKVLKTEVDRLLSATEQSLNYVRQIGRSEKQHINIGIIGSAIWGTLLTRLKAFREHNPDVNWTLTELSQQQQIEALRARTIDIAINRNVIPCVAANIRCQLISREAMRLAVHEHDPLARRRRVSLAELAQRPFISLSFSRGDFARQVNDACVEHGFHPLIVQQVFEPQTVLALVSAGNGVALLPETCALIHWPGVTFVTLEETIPADLYALWYDEPLPEVFSRLLTALRG
ncbi:LysR family transcriptional regulator [[Enterobacter] lignolyticus]|uniref:Transcriptional regulator, LysR family n=1 Tax=Enterobacter lignolyticus (strain SCF1) TaxID=701347 RepID=E3GBI4_ENTLS|nr:LysR family transcriptional regulator [[Enterobacter] lignolyticus]ADO50026.1 transcriptional regulator, LysR family [[Enterobacter] lignolyticus SCF1]